MTFVILITYVWAVQISDKIKEKSRRTKLKVWRVTQVVTFQWGSDSCFPIMLFCIDRDWGWFSAGALCWMLTGFCVDWLTVEQMVDQ